MKNNKGQALVEFVLILPVILAILLVIIDLGKIFNEKNTLENTSVDIIELYKNGKSIDEIKNKYNDIEIKTSIDNNYLTINLKKEIEIMTPGLNIVLDNPFPIEVERVVYYET